MYLVSSNHEDDFLVHLLTEDPDHAERFVLGHARSIFDPGFEVVKIEYQGDSLYTARYKPVPIKDEFEYVDNDGNPINADGSDIVEGTSLVEELPYEYDSIVWIIRPVTPGKSIKLSATDHYLLGTGLNHPFTDENATIFKIGS